jgi:SAM-dependent methyltransferase
MQPSERKRLPEGVEPISREWGFDRGTPIDRYYIEGFLGRHAGDVQGRVLEVGDDSYARRFGGDRYSACDVLDVSEGNPKATLVADLTSAEHVPSNRFDCIILTQTLHHIYDTRAALETLRRIMNPGGVLLATFPGISRMSHREWPGSWYWGFTSYSARRLFAEAFPGADVLVESHGNVLTASAFLYGIAAEDMRQDELDFRDPDYEVSITARVRKAEGATLS